VKRAARAHVSHDHARLRCEHGLVPGETKRGAALFAVLEVRFHQLALEPLEQP
jgi:hypothetical protein